MNLDELENRGLKSNKKESKPHEAEQETVELETTDNVQESSESPVVERTASQWKTILKLSVILSLLIGLLLGSIFGVLLGKSLFLKECPQNTDDGKESIYSQYDYTQFVINAEKNITIDNFYNNDEEKFYAMQIIGKTVPDLKYLDGENEVQISSLGKDRYIIEFVEPDCAFCNKMIDTVDGYRATENALDVIGLSIKAGDLSNFNKTATHTFHIINKDEDTNNLVKLIAWVPTFIYVENGTIQLVTFGNMKGVEDFQTNVDIAFN